MTISLFQKIKADQLQARKDRISGEVALLTTLLGEAGTVGKNQNRETNDDEVVAVVKKFIKGIDECMAVEKDEFNLLDLVVQKVILRKYLPKQLSDEEIVEVIDALYYGKKSPLTLKEIMGHFKQYHTGLYDGKQLSTLAAECIKTQE